MIGLRYVIKGLLMLAFLFVSACSSYLVHIKSDPPGAAVNDLQLGDLGVTDLTVQVGRDAPTKRESLNLTLTKAGYQTEKVDVLNVKKDQTIMVTLHSVPTTVLVETNPPSAQMEMYDSLGDPVELTNPSKIASQTTFANRRHIVSDDIRFIDLVLKQEGFKTLRKQIEIEPNKENRFFFQLEEIVGTLRLNTWPEGAAVYERSLGFLGRTPLELELKWDDLTRLSQKLDLMDTSDVNLQLKIKKTGYRTQESVEKFQLYLPNPPIFIDLPAE
ncbi:MAG: hypothetical protein MI864_16715 [Pseudomonadales bacterium]|nr:hypothetical protein [Pseudomonadales bacterium]